MGRTLFRGRDFRTGTIPVKEEELGEATVGSEILGGPFFKLGQAKGFSFVGKIEFSQEAIDPNIDGESVPTAVGVEKDAAGYFGSDSWELFEVSGGLWGRERGGDI